MTSALSFLGFDDRFEQAAAALLRPGLRLARITAVDRDAFLVRNEDGEIYAELAGRLRHEVESAVELPCVGDWVAVQSCDTGDLALVHHVVPRRTFLRRKAPGKSIDFQMIAANIDIAFIVQACGFDFNLARLDRYLVMAREGAIEPWIILTKTDLISPEQLAETLEQVKRLHESTPILALSNLTVSGLPEFRALLAPRTTYCLLGSSGVGKTTLINRLTGCDELETRAVSGTGEGVHTTSRRQMHALENGSLFIDTPGMRELGLLGTSGGLDDAFGDLRELSARCRYPDCSHTVEPGCAVLQAVKEGTFDEDRYRSYLKLKKETEYHDLSYVEKRRKDRSFGRFLKVAKRSMVK